MKPNVIAKVMEIDSANKSAERHSQNPMSPTTTTSAIASYKLDMKRSTFSCTCSG